MSSTNGKHNWPRLRLGEVIARHNEIIHPGDRTDGEAVFVGLEHVEPNTGRRIGSQPIDLARLSGRKPTFKKGQIVYGYLRPYLNKVWIAEFDGCSSVDQFAFDVRLDRADLDFVAAYMRSDVFLRRSHIVTTTGQLPRISIDEILKVAIDLPPLPEQKRIAGLLKEQLATVERARAAVKAQLAAAQALPAAYRRNVFANGHGWPLRAFGDVVDNCDGKRIPLKLDDRNQRKGDYPYYGASGIIDYIDDFLYDGDFLLIAEDGANLVARATPVAFKATGQFWVNNHAHVVRPRDGIQLDYLIHWFAQADISEYVSGAAQPKLSQAKLNELRVPVPPSQEQADIVQALNVQCGRVDALQASIRSESKELDALPAALLRDAFQGRV